MSQRLLILLDDEPVTSRTLALDLADAGYRVSTAADPREALRRLETEPIDLLIADESRETGDASRIVDEVRRVRPGTPVILMTTGPEAEGPAPTEGSVERVRKPFDLEEFRAIVGRLLGRLKETNGSAR